MRLVKSYGMEEYEVRRVQGLIATLQDLVYRAARVRSASSPIMEFLGGFAITVVILYGGARVIDGHTTPGAFFSFLTALMLAYRPLKSIGSLNNALQEGLAAASRTFSILDLTPTIVERPDAQPLQVDETGHLGVARRAVHLVSLGQQQLGQIGAVLTGDPGDQGSPTHWRAFLVLPGSGPRRSSCVQAVRNSS